MVTEYNRNLIMRRRMEAEKAALELEKAGVVQSAEVKAVEVKEQEKPKEMPKAEDKPEAKEPPKAETKKKTDAEKLKKGKK